MEVKYRIDDHELIGNLNKEYEIQAESITFIPIGDSAYSYRVDCANGDRYYLKLFDHQNDRQRANIERLKHYLPLTWSMVHQNLFQHLTYPIQTFSGVFQASFHHFTVVLFHFIEGESLAEAYPFPRKVIAEIAGSIAAIHRLTPDIDRSMLLTETYAISFETDLEKCMSVMEQTVLFDNGIKQKLRKHVLAKKEQIFSLLHLVRTLQGKATSGSKEQVLCHGDIWGGNIIRHDNTLYLIDWESAVMAPPELDIVGYLGEEFDVFLSAYEEHLGHSVTINLDLLRFFTYRRHLQNLTNWLKNILYRNTDQAQNENDLDMILHHCMNRFDRVESMVQHAEAILEKRA